LNFAAAVINGVEPRDQLEAMLAAQMASVHAATMKMAQQLALSDNFHAQDNAERAFNKLTRTFISQMEALKRYRTGGEQKVTVQHVNVSEGGQAIVGNVTQNARDTAPKDIQAKPRALAPPAEKPMEILAEPSPDPLPVRRKSRNDHRSSPQYRSHADQSALRSQDPQRWDLQAAGSPRKTTLSNARRGAGIGWRRKTIKTRSNTAYTPRKPWRSVSDFAI
jgi:hypothetical protein